MEFSDKERISDNEEMDGLLEPEDLFNDDAEEADDAQNENEKAEEKGKEGKPEKKSKPPRVGKKIKKMPSYDLLEGENGLSALKKLFQNFKFRGNGHEEEDLTKITNILQQWICYQLCPQYDFESGMLELEALGRKKIIQVLMKKHRLGMDDWSQSQPNADDAFESAEITENTNVFDSLPQEKIESTISNDEFTQNEVQKEPEVILTQEQLERIARNRKLAEEKRLKRISEQQKPMELIRTNEQEISPDGVTLE